MTPERRALLSMVACAALIAWLGQWADIDMRLATAMYDAPSGTFPMRHSWLGETFSHVVLKALLVSLALAVCLLAACDAARPCSLLSHRIRLRLRLVTLSSLLVPLVTAVLKRASSSHCPWDLAAFGGSQTDVRLFNAAILGAPAGHCMPAGHASSALWLVAIAVFLAATPAPHGVRSRFDGDGVGVLVGLDAAAARGALSYPYLVVDVDRLRHCRGPVRSAGPQVGAGNGLRRLRRLQRGGA